MKLVPVVMMVPVVVVIIVVVHVDVVVDDVVVVHVEVVPVVEMMPVVVMMRGLRCNDAALGNGREVASKVGRMRVYIKQCLNRLLLLIMKPVQTAISLFMRLSYGTWKHWDWAIQVLLRNDHKQMKT